MKQEPEGEGTRMEAKTYLEQARNINMQIDSKLEQVSALRQLVIKASSTLSPVPPSGTLNPHRLEETIARMMDMEQEVDEAIGYGMESPAHRPTEACGMCPQKVAEAWRERAVPGRPNRRFVERRF